MPPSDAQPPHIPARVAEAHPQDVGRGVVRLDPEILERHGLQTGDGVEVRGRRATVGLLGPGHPQDRASGVVRLDGDLRRNAQAGLEDQVRLRPLSLQEAETIVLAPRFPLHHAGATAYLRQHFRGRAMTRGDIVVLNVMGRRLEFDVVRTAPQGPLLSSGRTQFDLAKPLPEGERPEAWRAAPRVTYEDIGGLGDAIQRVREMIELPMRHPGIFERLGVQTPRGVLLFGPPGTGKTLLAKAVANESGASFHPIGGPTIMSKSPGEREENLRQAFEQAQKEAPAIVFIDEIDSIAPSREEATGEAERRVVAQLLALMDGLEARGQVVVLGATSRPNAIDTALRRPGRFDREIEIGAPDRDGRREVLQIHTRGMPLAAHVDLDKLASRTHGYVGADVAALTKEAAMRAVRRVLPEIDLDKEELPPQALEKLVVTAHDFDEALQELQPSALREVFVQRPDIRWSQVGGLDEAKQALVESVEWPLTHAEAYQHYGARAPKGVLLFGPPGTGKTLLAKAVAGESQANFISVKGPEFLSKWVGESERAVREVFRKARQAAPCVIFFDELDALAPTRSGLHDSGVTERVVSQILTEMDGLEALRGVTILGATNRPDMIDPALRRPGRFDRLVEVPLPDVEARRRILDIHTRGTPMADGVDLAEWARRTEGWSGAELAQLPQEASLHALRVFLETGQTRPGERSRVTAADFETAYHRLRAQHAQAPHQTAAYL